VYTTIDELKAYLGVTTGGDDALLTALVERAQKAIETHTHRVFEAASDTTRTFTVGVDTDGRALYFDRDLAQITSIVTNADASSGGTTIPSTDYITLPRHDTPYYGVRLLSSSDYVWEFTDDPENGVEVTGRWAYSVTAPEDIVHACTRLAGYYFKQRESQVFDVTAMPDAGALIIPRGLPKDVEIILSPYVRRL
jgi:hypothetical protein